MAYWTAHKDVYERGVLFPMKALLAELASEFGDGKVCRPNRDVRFSPDKSPHKAQIGAHFRERGDLSHRPGSCPRTLAAVSGRHGDVSTITRELTRMFH
jgi:uncharacterized protein (DUF2461 family)